MATLDPWPLEEQQESRTRFRGMDRAWPSVSRGWRPADRSPRRHSLGAQHRALLLRARDGRQPRPHATQDALCRSAWERGPRFTYATCGPLVRNAACSSRRRVTCAGMLDVCRVPNTLL